MFATDTISGQLACILEQFKFLPFATQRVAFNGIESASYGSVIISSLTASTVTNISSISDTRIGVGFVQSAGTYKLAYQVGGAAYLFWHTRIFNGAEWIHFFEY